VCLTIDKSKNTVILDIAYGFAYGLQEYRFQISNVWLHSLTVCRYWTERYRALYEGNSNCKQPGRYIAGRLSLHIIRNNIYIHTAQLLTFQPIFVPLKKKQNALLRFPCGLCVCAVPTISSFNGSTNAKENLGTYSHPSDVLYKHFPSVGVAMCTLLDTLFSMNFLCMHRIAENMVIFWESL
jgi:hypothetical protein